MKIKIMILLEMVDSVICGYEGLYRKQGGWKMRHVRFRTIVFLALIFIVMDGSAKMALGMGKNVAVPRMTKEKLNSLLGNSDLDVIILDVRLGKEWYNSKWKIKGAVREDPEKDVKAWADKYPKDKTLVLYCS